MYVYIVTATWNGQTVSIVHMLYHFTAIFELPFWFKISYFFIIRVMETKFFHFYVMCLQHILYIIMLITIKGGIPTGWKIYTNKLQWGNNFWKIRIWSKAWKWQSFINCIKCKVHLCFVYKIMHLHISALASMCSLNLDLVYINILIRINFNILLGNKTFEPKTKII